MKYPPLPNDALELEDGQLVLWREEELFQQTLDATAAGEPFVFYEGPPTANGRPGLHHLISRTIKDLVCRHRTMQGRSVTRIAGWDTHGLPVEIEAERRLGISGKPEIEAVGIARFNEVCRDSVFTYKEEWERFSDRIGYWLDYSRPYVTFHPEYIESVWHILKQLSERGFLYRGHKSVPYCPRCGTALSSHEVAQGYADVKDPSLFFLCDWEEDGELDPERRSFLVWTTTPWTVPSNAALAIHPELEYAEVEWEGRGVVLASALVERVFGEGVTPRRRYQASELIGRHYRRPLDLVPLPSELEPTAWSVVAEDFVSAEEGTGIVHMAPAFGADDFVAGQKHGLPLLNPIDDAGAFLVDIPLVGGVFVKDADSILLEEIKQRGGLFRAGTIVHSYPHCWRCQTPLLYMARDSWFASTASIKDEMIEENRRIGWHPPEVGEGRMGDWLEGNVDWALSRDRFWGTPLPVWVCENDQDHVRWVGGFEELAELAGPLPDPFDPHRPFIDDITFPCPDCAGEMRRTPAVVDVWFDSGAMPYAQWHYPFEGTADFERNFPADFICEGLDQTRGWFYSLLAISTMLGRGSPYKNVIVNDLILDAEGQKMSKSKGNVVNPWEAIEEFGVDALRWYLITVSNPWVPKRYDPAGVREAAGRFFDTLLNTYRFFSLYANAEGWQPSDADSAPEDRSFLDRWLISRLTDTVASISADLEAYQPTRAYRSLDAFLNGDLSNWYVRRSRSRFWGSDDKADGRDAFRTLYDTLTTVSALVAPVAPFTADWLHRALTGSSAHLASFPEATTELHDAALEEEMADVRMVVSLGRAAREEVQIRVRQPLRRLIVVLPEGRELSGPALALILDELNLKQVEFRASTKGLIRLSARPNFRALGPRFQDRSEGVATAIRSLSSPELEHLRADGSIQVDVGGESFSLSLDEMEIVEDAEGDLVLRGEGAYAVALDPQLDDGLVREGLARELVNRTQRLRRDSGLEITDRITLGVFGVEDIRAAAEAHSEFISGETLAESIAVGERPEGDYEFLLEVEIDGSSGWIGLRAVGG